METWRVVWRDGLAPVLPTEGLESLWQALRDDDPRLVQGATTMPAPLRCNSQAELNGCCSIGWCGWKGEELKSVGAVEEFFARICFEADQRLGEMGATRWYLNWFDDTPRSQMRAELLREVERTLEQRFVKNVLDRVMQRRQRRPSRKVSAA